MSSLGHQLTTSVLVVGTGASGLRAAIEVAEAGVAVVVVTQRPREDAPASAGWDDAEWAPASARLGEPGSGTRLTRRGRAACRPLCPASGPRHAPPRSPSMASSPTTDVPAAPTSRPPHGSPTRTCTGPCVCARQLAIPVLPHVYVTRRATTERCSAPTDSASSTARATSCTPTR
ncbi:FAD-binding protein [Streptomyces canus]|uniref:FAD-binding protein n=1 Tax=Streptomyces canus TaxID=58343 RepID=UPI00367CD597